MSNEKIHRDQPDFSSKFKQEFEKARSNIKKPNILILGGTGAGKSSLVNLVFGKELAQVGAGLPITKGIKEYANELVRIYDSEGYESGEDGQERYKRQVLDFIKQQQVDLNKRVHLAWYCISLANHRLFDIDIKTINEIATSKMPIAVVLTQADQVSDEDSKSMRDTVNQYCPGVVLFEMSTDPELHLPVEPLINWSFENLDVALREGFISAAKFAVQLKRKQSLIIVAEHSALAAGISASPIPFSDALLLVGNQMAMIARLASIWDLPNLKSVAAGGLFSQLVSQLGRTLAGNLLKLVPGAGSIVGGTINASVASAITGAVGFALTEICEKISTDELNGIVKDVSTYFNENLLSALIKSKMPGSR